METEAKNTLAIGMVTVAEQHIDAQAEFAFAEHSWPSEFKPLFTPKTAAKALGPDAIATKLQSRIMRSYHQIGGTFGPTALFPDAFPHLQACPAHSAPLLPNLSAFGARYDTT